MDSGGVEEALGKRLQQARQRAGLTQQQLCQKTGLSYSTLAKIERGAIKSPSIFTIQQIASAIGSSLDELVGSGPVASGKNRSKSGVAFAYFDINGCLVRFFHRAFTKLSEDSGEVADIVETAFWHYNDSVCRGEITMAEFNKKLAKDLGMDSLDWQKYYMEAIDPIPQMHELLKWTADHYKIGLISNIMPGSIKELLKKGFIPDLKYDAVIDSSEVGSIKPEHKIYEIAQQKAGVQPAEILLVDDGRPNIMAAEKLGWHVLWFDDYHPAESAKRVRAALEPAD